MLGLFSFVFTLFESNKHWQKKQSAANKQQLQQFFRKRIFGAEYLKRKRGQSRDGQSFFDIFKEEFFVKVC